MVDNLNMELVERNIGCGYNTKMLMEYFKRDLVINGISILKEGVGEEKINNHAGRGFIF